MGSQIQIQTISQSPSFITVSQGQIPVILYRDYNQAQEIAARAVNFLRSGCPVVQVIIDTPGIKGEEDLEDMRKKLSDAVGALSVFIAYGITKNEVFGVRPHCETRSTLGTFGNKNYILQVYKA